jgi:hypothetical protein
MVLIGWTWRQPTMAGSTVTTLMGRRGPAAQPHSTGEAADIRNRGGQWRASGPQGREATEPVGANFHHQPAHGNSRLSAIETADWHGEFPQMNCGEDVKRSSGSGATPLALPVGTVVTSVLVAVPTVVVIPVQLQAMTAMATR